MEGRERYPVNVRYLRDYRSDMAACSVYGQHAFGRADSARADRGLSAEAPVRA